MIRTARLQLVPATVELLSAELQSPARLAAVAGFTVPSSWPPEHHEPSALEYVLTRLIHHEEYPEWWFAYLVHGADPALVVGTAGFKGPPRNGAVEIGYSVLPEYQRRGFASEAARGLVARAFEESEVDRVVAHTLPHLLPSIGVLVKCGFLQVDGPAEAEEAGAIRFELPRAAWLGT